jgi:exodeoxyribonuclease V gamma subunit
MATAPRRGDPSLRDEDRFLFLETLLSARERLYVSYVGQSVRDNSEAPPSVLVSELLDAVEQGFEATPGATILNRLVTRHRLQAFSPAYFRGREPLFSYSRENFDAVRARLGGAPSPCPFLREPLPEPDAELRTVDVGRLASFLSHPARFFLVERLGVRLERASYGIEDREPFEVDGLDRYRIEQDLTLRYLALPLADQDSGLDEERELLRAQGVLPPGSSGDASFAASLSSARGLAGRVHPHLQGEELTHLDLDLHLGDFRLVGRLRGLWPGGLVRFRAANVKPKDRLRLWVEHLALSCAATAGHPRTSLLLGRDQGFRYRGPSDSREQLCRLLDLYWEGLRRPVPLLPAASLEYARRWMDPKTRDGALVAAHRKWAGSDFDQGEPAEGQDAYNALCFRDVDPLGDDFLRRSLEILAPLLAHEEKL